MLTMTELNYLDAVPGFAFPPSKYTTILAILFLYNIIGFLKAKGDSNER